MVVQGGHALVALKTGGADPVYKATIMPRGQALGMVTQLPDGDQTSMSKKQILARSAPATDRQHQWERWL